MAVILIKIATGILAVVAAKPETFLKLFSAKLGIDFSTFKRERSYGARIAFLDEFSEEFQRIVRLIGKGKPLVVIIDDLDRCLPEKAIQVLEAIKLFLDVKGCVFLLAVDQEVVENAIALKYKDLLAVKRQSPEQPVGSSTFLGENYFEKIIQLPFALPPLARDDIGRLVSHLWQDEGTKACAAIFAAGLPPNPRKVKRNLQVFFLLHQLAKSRIDEGVIKPSLLAKMVIIQNQFREVYRDLATSTNLMEALEDYFRHNSTTNDREPSDSVTFEPVLAQKVETYAVRYPALRGIFVQEIGPDDTFKGAPIEDYVFFVKAVTEAPIKLERSASDDRETNVRQYFSYLLQQSKTFPIQSDADAFSKGSQLNKLFVEPLLAKVSTGGVDSPPLKPAEILKRSARVLVLGSPAAGKTSLLKYLVLLVLKEPEHENLSKGTSQPVAPGRFPILLVANQLAKYGRLSGAGPQDALKLIEGYYSQLNIPITAKDLQSFFEEGRCVLFVDGLDEVPESEYPLVVDFLNLLTSRYPTNQYVASTRTTRGLSRGASPLIGFDLYEILPLDEEQLNEFVSKALPSKDRGSELVQLLSGNTPLRAMSTNPLFLSIIVALYSQTHTLPTSLLGAIDEYVEMSLGRWDQMRGIHGPVSSVPRHMVKPALAGIALHMHEGRTERIRKPEVVDLICRQIGVTQMESAELLYQLQSREGLFNEVAEGIYEFVHLLLKQFLVAEAVIAQSEPISIVLKHRDDAYWRMVIQFVAGRLGDWGSEHFTELIDSLIDVNDANRILLAAECFLMNPLAAPSLRGKFLEELERIGADEAFPSEIHMRALELEKRIREAFSK